MLIESFVLAKKKINVIGIMNAFSSAHVKSNTARSVQDATEVRTGIPVYRVNKLSRYQRHVFLFCFVLQSLCARKRLCSATVISFV